MSVFLTPAVLFFSLLLGSLQTKGQQNPLHINNMPIDHSVCYEIKKYKTIPEVLPGYLCEIKDAQIIGDCLELTIVYGGCNGNLELITDSLISKDSKLNFKLRWIDPSFCKASVLTKVSFDLKPYQTVIKEKMASVKIMGANFELFYNN